MCPLSHEVLSKKYWSVSEVASYLEVSEKFVYRHQKEIPGWFKLAGKVFFDKDVLITSLGRKAQHKSE